MYCILPQLKGAATVLLEIELSFNLLYAYHQSTILSVPAHEVHAGCAPNLHPRRGLRQGLAINRYRYWHAAAALMPLNRGADRGLSRQAPAIGVQPPIVSSHVRPHEPVLLFPLNRLPIRETLRVLALKRKTV